jgi:hypothetical protein
VAPSFSRKLPKISIDDVTSAGRPVVWRTKVVMNKKF